MQLSGRRRDSHLKLAKLRRIPRLNAAPMNRDVSIKESKAQSDYVYIAVGDSLGCVIDFVVIRIVAGNAGIRG